MNRFSGQIERIKIKLAQAKAVDNNNDVFGASSHQYFIDELAITPKWKEDSLHTL